MATVTVRELERIDGENENRLEQMNQHDPEEIQDQDVKTEEML